MHNQSESVNLAGELYLRALSSWDMPHLIQQEAPVVGWETRFYVWVYCIRCTTSSDTWHQLMPVPVQIAMYAASSDSISLRKQVLELAALHLTSKLPRGAVTDVAALVVKAGKAACASAYEQPNLFLS